MHIVKKVSPSGVWCEFRFPFRIGKIEENRYWQRFSTTSLTGGLTKNEDQLMAIEKLKIFGELLKISRLPVDRVDICNQFDNALEVKIEDGPNATAVIIFSAVDKLLEQAFQLEVTVK